MIKLIFAYAVVGAIILTAPGCGGCSSLEPIPGGFPSAARTPNAGQIRISQSGLTSISADPAALLGGLLGMGGLQFNVPPSCGGNPEVCCPGGVPQTTCGPIQIDLAARPGDLPRMELHPASGASRLDVTVRARVKTLADIPVKIPLVGNCGIAIDTAPGPNPDIKLDIPVRFVQDPLTGTTRIEPGDVVITQLTSQDVRLTGSIGCQLASLGLGAFIGTLTSTFADAIKSAISDQACKACPSGDVAECGPFATSCMSNVCTKADNTCLQEIGIDGRARGASLFGSLSPGTAGGMDVYEVAGGYGTTDNSGIALGLLGGMRPAGTPRDRCGPAATGPARVTIPQSTFFQGNTRPDTGTPFGLAFGLHQSQIDEMAYSLYDGGMLCLTITNRTVDLLNTTTIGLLAPSITNLVSKPGAIAIGLRPQAPPRMVLGANTFVTTGGTTTVDEPLLDINFTGLELDFYASVEDQYVRLFTVVTDLHLPLGMQVGATGDLVPVFGDLAGAFTNLSVKNNDAVTEDPAVLAQRFPTLLELALPGLANGLGSFALPNLGGLAIHVTSITAVDNKTFLAIFADLAPATMPRAAVETTAEITDFTLPSAAAAADPDRWAVEPAPRIELALGGDATDLEWSWRTDDGLWSAWSPVPTQTVSNRGLWLPGTHRIEVRARIAGVPETTDLTPVEFVVPVAPELAAKPAGFHGAPGEGGCNCASHDAGVSDCLPMVLALGFLGLGRRRRPNARTVRRLLIASVVLAIGATMPACDCGGTPACGDKDCLPGSLEPGILGRYNAVASDGTRTVVTTYDSSYGDLVAVDVAADGTRTPVAVDGIADETPRYSPSTYRGGIAGFGPDVGTFTSVTLSAGKAQVAYQDVEHAALKYAFETKVGDWSNYVIQDDTNVLGAFTSMALSSGGAPAIAFLAEQVPVAGGGRETQLRLARARSATPTSGGDWTIGTVARAPASCAGACGTDVCLAAATATDPELCATPTTDCTTACSDTQACIAGVCKAVIATPAAVGLPTGTGLFANLLALADGRLAIVFYDRSRTSLVLLVESAAGSSTFAETVLDASGDRGWWASAVVGPDGVIHVGYQDARADTVYYVSWNGTAGTPELVDDGTRTGDRTHPVGAGATVFLSGSGPAIAYQDGNTADLVVAKKSGAAWSTTTLATGRVLDGFHIAVGGNTIAWDSLDPVVIPPGKLSIGARP
jgi:uncharacterized protein (TIGR03382 family)